MFLTIKKKAIVAGLLSILLIAGAVLALYLSRPASYPKPEFSVCIDAGHGGLDVKKEQYSFCNVLKKKAYRVDML